VTIDELKNAIRNRIIGGEFAEGAQIPSEFDLIRSMNVTRAQAREALVELEVEGYINRYQGRGSFVAPAENRIKRLGIRGFRLVAMSCNQLSSHYKRTVMEAFASELHEYGVQTLTYFLDQESDAEKRFLQGIRTSGVEGLALWLADRADDTREVLSSFKETHFPFVLCDRYLPGFEADMVLSNNEEIGYELTLGLIARGFSRIAFLGSRTRVTSTEDREVGYRRALTETGISAEEGNVRWPDASEDSVVAEVKELMAQRVRPTALVCGDDRIVSIAANALTELGYALPRDMTFATVDDDRGLQDLGLPVVSLRQDGARIGRETARLLMARMENPERPVEQVVVEAHVNSDLGGDGYLFGRADVAGRTDYSVRS
jgi:GntR family transcriptional regulator of arabinose operon